MADITPRERKPGWMQEVFKEAKERLDSLPDWYRKLLEDDYKLRQKRMEEESRLREQQMNEPG